MQDYIDRFGVWKCEANALVGNPDGANEMFEEAINRFIPHEHLFEIDEKNEPAQDAVKAEIAELVKTWTPE